MELLRSSDMPDHASAPDPARIVCVVGARPNFVKIALILAPPRLVHTSRTCSWSPAIFPGGRPHHAVLRTARRERDLGSGPLSEGLAGTSQASRSRPMSS